MLAINFLCQVWDQLGASFESSKDVVIAKVDADAHKELGNRFSVHGYPTLKWFPKGETTPEEYVLRCLFFFFSYIV
jgi:protein disulfide-isomerase A6